MSNFAMFYSHAQARSKLPKKRRRVLQPHEIKVSRRDRDASDTSVAVRRHPMGAVADQRLLYC